MDGDGAQRRNDTGNHGDPTGTGAGTRQENHPNGGNVRGVANFAGRIESPDKLAQGGNGFGLEPNPRFISSNFNFSPHKNIKYQKEPHAFTFRPPDSLKFKIGPQTVQKSYNYPNFVSENRFAPLLETSAAFHVYNVCDTNSKGWIFDCGATDSMTPDRRDFFFFYEGMKSYIKTANGELISVEGSGTIEISPTLRLTNCLYVPTLSQRLMSISHVTKELNCTLLMHPDFCIL